MLLFRYLNMKSRFLFQNERGAMLKLCIFTGINDRLFHRKEPILGKSSKIAPPLHCPAPGGVPWNHVEASQMSQLNFYHLNNLPFSLNQVGMAAACPDRVTPKTSLPCSYTNKMCFHLILITTRPKVGVATFSNANLSLFMKDS